MIGWGLGGELWGFEDCYMYFRDCADGLCYVMGVWRLVEVLFGFEGLYDGVGCGVLSV